MDEEYLILDSAYKHGITEESIRNCLANVKGEELIQTFPEKSIRVGFDQNANPLEIIGIKHENIYVVIHAMKLRKQYFYLLEGA